MTNMYWKIDAIQSHMMGQFLKGVIVPRLSHPLNAEPNWQIWVELVFICICHRTNWDLLHNRIIEIASKDLTLLFPSNLEKMSAKEFQDLFRMGLGEGGNRDLSERLRYLNRLGRFVNAWPNNTAVWLMRHPVQLEGERGLYSWLRQIPIFAEDPLQKKSRVLVHQLLRYGLIEVADPENVYPAVDYHIIRSYLRTGRVLAIRPEYASVPADGQARRVEFITHLRSAVEQAMWYSAFSAGLQMADLNYIEWQIARSFCVKKAARCTSTPLPEKPVDPPIAFLSEEAGGNCPWYNHCYGARDPELRKLIDPRSAKAYY